MVDASTDRDTVVIVGSHRDVGDVEQLHGRLPAQVRARTVHEWVDIAVWQPSAEEWAAYIAEVKRTLAELRVDLAERWEAEAREIPHRFTQQQAGLILWRLKHAFAHACAVVLLVGRGLLAASAAWREELALLLGAAAEQGAIILPVLVDVVSDADFLLGRFAPVNDPDRPMSALAPEEREQAWARVAEAAQAALARSQADAQLEADEGAGSQKPGTLLRVLHGQIGSALGLAWSPDSRRIAAACDDTRVYVWEAETGERLLTYEGHQDEVNAVAWSPDSTRLASVAENAQVWEATTGRRLVTYDRHAGHEALAVAWSPDGRQIATGGWDKTVQVWDATTGEQRLTYSGHTDQVNSVAWSPDGRRIVSGAGDAWNGNVRDPTAQVWQAETGEHLLTYPGYLDPVRVVAWSPDGGRIASVNPATQVWDATTGQRLIAYTGHAWTVRALAWSPEGSRIVTSGDDGTAQVWDASTGAKLLVYRGHTGTFAGATGGIFAVAWSPDGKRIASGDGREVHVWAAAAGQEATSR